MKAAGHRVKMAWRLGFMATVLAMAGACLLAGVWTQPDTDLALPRRHSAPMPAQPKLASGADRCATKEELSPQAPVSAPESCSASRLIVELLLPEQRLAGPSNGILMVVDSRRAVVAERALAEPCDTSTHEFDLASAAGSQLQVLAEFDGIPTLAADVVWATPSAAGSSGHARLAWDVGPSVITGRAVDPKGNGIAQTRLVLTTADRRIQVATPDRRARLGSRGVANAVTVTTGSDGCFVARGLRPGAVKLHSLDPRFECIPDGRGRHVDVGVASGVPQDEQLVVKLARVYELTVRARLQIASGSTGIAEDRLVAVDLVSLPKFPGESHATEPRVGGEAFLPRPTDERLVAMKLSLEAAEWRPARLEWGEARVSRPGYTSMAVPVAWHAVGEGSESRGVVLRPVLSGHPSRVEICLRDCPGFLDASVVWFAVTYVEDGGAARTVFAGAQVVGDRAVIDADFPPGDYELGSDLLNRSVKLRVPQSPVAPTQPVVVAGSCVGLAGIAIRVRGAKGREFMSYASHLSPAGSLLQGRIQGPQKPAGLPNVTFGLRLIGSARSGGELRYFLVDPPEAIRVQVSAQGYGFLADDVHLKSGEMTAVTLAFE